MSSVSETLWTIAPQAPLSMILQARIVEWVATPSSTGSSSSRDQTLVSCLLHWQAGSLPLVLHGEHTHTHTHTHVYTSRIAEFYAHSVSILLRNCQTVFHSYHTILNSHQQCTGIPVSPCPPRHLLVSAALIVAVLTGSRRYLIVVLIFISLVTRELGQLVMC